jgi:drug/metabolite transporter (DMT)-like permease
MSCRAWVQLLTLAALWGAVYPLIAVALRELSPVAVVFGRVALATLLLTPIAVHRHALRPLWHRKRRR